MDTRKYAVTLRELADFLDSRPKFEIECGNMSKHLSFYSKDKFVEAVRAIGDATKGYGEGEYAQFKVTSKHVPLTLSISRDAVCKKIVKYECEPLFSLEEMEAL